MTEEFKLSDCLVERVDNFGSLVMDWNRFSLVANSTLSDMWGWHFNEAFSIISLLEANKHLKLYDFGAGGGVIGYPLFLYGFDVWLVERSSNKMFFFERILKYEYAVQSVVDFSGSLVIARGIGSVFSLLKMLKNVQKLVLFKSFLAKKEVEEALKFWDFKIEYFNRVGRAKGLILYIYDIVKKC